LLFSFVLCVNILKQQQQQRTQGGVDDDEWRFLLTGGVGLANTHSNPVSSWLPAQSWDQLCRLDQLPAFRNIRATFVKYKRQWKAFYDSTVWHLSLMFTRAHFVTFKPSSLFHY